MQHTSVCFTFSVMIFSKTSLSTMHKYMERMHMFIHFTLMQSGKIFSWPGSLERGFVCLSFMEDLMNDFKHS